MKFPMRVRVIVRLTGEPGAKLAGAPGPKEIAKSGAVGAGGVTVLAITVVAGERGFRWAAEPPEGDVVTLFGGGVGAAVAAEALLLRL